MSGPAAPSGKRLRLMTWVLGVILLIWLPLEDTSTSTVTLLAVAASTLGVLRMIGGSERSSKRRWFSYPLAGLLGGTAVTPVVLILMAIKTGLHGHGAPDFSPEQILTVLYRTPLFATAGLFIGLGVGLWEHTKGH